MKLKYEMSLMDIDNEKMAVPLDSGDGFRGVLQMNGTTERIIELLSTDTTEDAVVSTLLEEYDAPKEKIEANVRKVLDILYREGLLEK